MWFSRLKSLFSAQESEVWCVPLGRCNEDVMNGKGWAGRNRVMIVYEMVRNLIRSRASAWERREKSR